MKRVFLNILIIVICGAMLSASLLVPVAETETADPQILYTEQAEYLLKDIYVDGRHYDNWALVCPVVRVNGTIYVPVDISALVREEKTDRVGELSGSAIIVPQAVQEKTPASLSEDSDPAPKAPGLDSVRTALLSYNCDHSFRGFQVTTGYKELCGLQLPSTTDIAISESGAYYASENFLRNVLGIDVCTRDPGGVYLSTDPAVSASRWAASDTNTSYSEGVKWYIMEIGMYVSPYQAEWYEYLMRHVAGTLEYITPKLMFGVINVESRFDTEAGSSAGAIGLMQVLSYYAADAGYTVEMLQDPHLNMEYGAPMLDEYIREFGGDVTRALAAYNQGISAVRSNPNYSRWYPNLVFKRIEQLENWLAANGYSTEFVDQLVLIDQ